MPGQCLLSGLEKKLSHGTESPRQSRVHEWAQVVLLKGEQCDSFLRKQNYQLVPWSFQNVLGGEVQVSVLHTTWFCTEAIQSANRNKECVYNSQQWDFNNQQFPTASRACGISGILGFGLKVKWQVFGLEEQYVLRKAQHRFLRVQGRTRDSYRWSFLSCVKCISVSAFP